MSDRLFTRDQELWLRDRRERGRHQHRPIRHLAALRKVHTSSNPVDDSRAKERPGRLASVGSRIRTDQIVREANVELLDGLDGEDLLAGELES